MLRETAATTARKLNYRESASRFLRGTVHRFSRGTVLNMLKQSGINILRGKKDFFPLKIYIYIFLVLI